MKRITDYQVVGSSKRCLVLNIDGQRVFCSTKNYADLCMKPDLKWEVIERPEQRVIDQFGHEKLFHSSLWVVAYVPRIIWYE